VIRYRNRSPIRSRNAGLGLRRWGCCAERRHHHTERHPSGTHWISGRRARCHPRRRGRQRTHRGRRDGTDARGLWQREPGGIAGAARRWARTPKPPIAMVAARSTTPKPTNTFEAPRSTVSCAAPVATTTPQAVSKRSCSHHRAHGNRRSCLTGVSGFADHRFVFERHGRSSLRVCVSRFHPPSRIGRGHRATSPWHQSGSCARSAVPETHRRLDGQRTDATCNNDA